MCCHPLSIWIGCHQRGWNHVTHKCRFPKLCPSHWADNIALVLKVELRRSFTESRYRCRIGRCSLLDPCVDLARRCDIFSLGVVLYESLAGVNPLESPNVANRGAANIQTEIPPPSSLASTLPKSLDHACMTALKFDPNQRWKTAKEFADALESLSLESSPDRANTDDKTEAATPQTSRQIEVISLVKYALGILFFTNLGVLTWGLLANSYRVASVTVAPRADFKERFDLGLPGSKDRLPDYRLEIKSTAGSSWIDCGTFMNRQIGEGLTWTVKNLVPIRELIEMRMLETDIATMNDTIDQTAYSGQTSSGPYVQFIVESEFSLDAGYDWVFDHPLGQTFIVALAAIVFIGLLIVVVPLTFLGDFFGCLW